VPMVYDEFSRQYLASILCEGYPASRPEFYTTGCGAGHGPLCSCSRPSVECPTRGRSAQHIWKRGPDRVTYEIYRRPVRGTRAAR